MEEEKGFEETENPQGAGEAPKESPEVAELQARLEALEREKEEALKKFEDQRIRAEKAEKAKKLLDPLKVEKTESSFEPIELVKVGKKLQDYSDDELDFVVEHSKSKNPDDILKTLENPFIQAGIKARREQLERERQTLNPAGSQPEVDKPRSFTEKVKAASSLKEQEELLKKAGLYREPRRDPNSMTIGM